MLALAVLAATRVRAEGCSRTGASSELPTSKLRTGRSQINLEPSNSLEIHTRTRAHTITGSQSKTHQENRKPLNLLWPYKFKSLGLRSPTWNLSLAPRHRHGPRSASSHCSESWVRLSCLGFSGHLCSDVSQLYLSAQDFLPDIQTDIYSNLLDFSP